jgi:hypothetical protein
VETEVIDSLATPGKAAAVVVVIELIWKGVVTLMLANFGILTTSRLVFGA